MHLRTTSYNMSGHPLTLQKEWWVLNVPQQTYHHWEGTREYYALVGATKYYHAQREQPI